MRRLMLLVSATLSKGGQLGLFGAPKIGGSGTTTHVKAHVRHTPHGMQLVGEHDRHHAHGKAPEAPKGPPEVPALPPGPDLHAAARSLSDEALADKLASTKGGAVREVLEHEHGVRQAAKEQAAKVAEKKGGPDIPYVRAPIGDFKMQITAGDLAAGGWASTAGGVPDLSTIDGWNNGEYPGTGIRLRKVPPDAILTVEGNGGGAKVTDSDGGWIADRFGKLGARNVRSLIDSGKGTHHGALEPAATYTEPNALEPAATYTEPEPEAPPRAPIRPPAGDLKALEAYHHASCNYHDRAAKTAADPTMHAAASDAHWEAKKRVGRGETGTIASDWAERLSADAAFETIDRGPEQQAAPAGPLPDETWDTLSEGQREALQGRGTIGDQEGLKAAGLMDHQGLPTAKGDAMLAGQGLQTGKARQAVGLQSAAAQGSKAAERGLDAMAAKEPHVITAPAHVRTWLGIAKASLDEMKGYGTTVGTAEENEHDRKLAAAGEALTITDKGYTLPAEHAPMLEDLLGYAQDAMHDHAKTGPHVENGKKFDGWPGYDLNDGLHTTPSQHLTFAEHAKRAVQQVEGKKKPRATNTPAQERARAVKALHKKAVAAVEDLDLARTSEDFHKHRVAVNALYNHANKYGLHEEADPVVHAAKEKIRAAERRRDEIRAHQGMSAPFLPGETEAQHKARWGYTQEDLDTMRSLRTHPADLPTVSSPKIVATLDAKGKPAGTIPRGLTPTHHLGVIEHSSDTEHIARAHEALAAHHAARHAATGDLVHRYAQDAHTGAAMQARDQIGKPWDPAATIARMGASGKAAEASARAEPPKPRAPKPQPGPSQADTPEGRVERAGHASKSMTPGARIVNPSHLIAAPEGTVILNADPALDATIGLRKHGTRWAPVRLARVADDQGNTREEWRGAAGNQHTTADMLGILKNNEYRWTGLVGGAP